MSVNRWDPFGEMAALRDRVNRMLEGMLSPPAQAGGRAGWAPPVDILETEEALILRADVPGVRQQDLEIELDSDRLTLRGERPAGDGTALRRERPWGRVERSFAIGVPIDQAKVKATYRDGVLEITLPKAVEARRRQVKVQVK